MDWRGVGEASLSIAGGTAELVLAAGGEWFSAGLSIPVSIAIAVDGSARMGTASIKLMAAFGGMKEARNIPGNLGGLIGLGIDNLTGSTKGKGQKIGGLINDAATVILTGELAELLPRC